MKYKIDIKIKGNTKERKTWKKVNKIFKQIIEFLFVVFTEQLIQQILDLF